MGFQSWSTTQLTIDLMAQGKISPKSFREQMQGAWSTVGIVAALLLSILVPVFLDEHGGCDGRVIHAMGISEETCAITHCVLSAFGTSASCVATLVCTILYVRIAKVPDDCLPAWAEKSAFLLLMPNGTVQVACVVFVCDLAWLACHKYGPTAGLLCALILVLPSVIVGFLNIWTERVTVSLIREVHGNPREEKPPPASRDLACGESRESTPLCAAA
eukprot:TRINITY_DN111873_c0_g1_i1.p1 TRINITY_DN111873_c0_g1~~TRINITY_DN111873_c0_g1_i1.p1  ORF type:complete len:246 (-),score=9.03 TRINITY_DN111873_c0_g1_i1:266-916(-)